MADQPKKKRRRKKREQLSEKEQAKRLLVLTATQAVTRRGGMGKRRKHGRRRGRKPGEKLVVYGPLTHLQDLVKENTKLFQRYMPSRLAGQGALRKQEKRRHDRNARPTSAVGGSRRRGSAPPLPQRPSTANPAGTSSRRGDSVLRESPFMSRVRVALAHGSKRAKSRGRSKKRTDAGDQDTHSTRSGELQEIDMQDLLKEIS